jgi:hypothetical protein
MESGDLNGVGKFLRWEAATTKVVGRGWRLCSEATELATATAITDVT